MKKNIPKILIVDDDQLYLKQFSTILKKEIQAKYYFSYNARDATELINRNSYAIILLDVNIPEKSGFELARDVRDSKLNKHTPIIFITGISIDDQSVFEGYKAGAVDYLSKPVNKFILFSKIKTFLKLDLQKNELLDARDKFKKLNKNLEIQVDKRTLQLVKEIDENVTAKANLQMQANQLGENNLFLENLLETIPNPVYYKNEKGEYLGCNKAFEEFLSKTKQDIIGKTIFNLVSKEFADRLNILDMETNKSGKKRIEEIKFLNFDSPARNLILYKSRFQVAHSKKTGIIGTVVDITDLTKAKGLLKIQHTIDYISSLEKGKRDIFKNILNSIIEIDWVDSGGIYLMDEEKQDLTLVCHKGLSKKFINRSKYFPTDSAQAKLVLSKKPIYSSYEKLAGISSKQAQEENLKVLAIIPLIYNQKVIGALNVASKTKDKISETDKTGIESLSSRIGNLIVYAQTQDELKLYQKELELKVGQRTKELHNANLKLIEEIEFHKRTKSALSDSENKYRSIFENAQDGIVLYDAETLELVDMNKKAHEDLGYTYAEFKNLKYGDFVIYKDRKEREALLEQLFSKGITSFQAKHKKKNGEICYRIIKASLLDLNDKRYIQGIIHDISEIKEKEIELQKSEKKFNELQSNIPIGMYITNLEGKFLYANNTVVNMLGYDSEEEMLKVSVLDIYYDKNKRIELIERLKQKGYLNNVELQIVRKDKSAFWGSISVKTIFDKKGEVIRLDGIIEDISERKEVQLNLVEAHEEIKLINRNLEKKIKNALKEEKKQQQYIIQKSKLESLGELAAGIAHEINQPLGIMTLAFENLESKFNSGNITKEYLKQKTASIIENIDRIRDIINHIRIFSREHESIVMEKVNVNRVILDVHKLIKTQYHNHNINIVNDLHENPGFTVGSKLKLEQVLLNLLSNSKHALEENEINHGEEYFKTIRIGTGVVDNRINLMFEDNGIGIDPKYINKVFDPFFTTKPEWDGTGLGLSIVYGIIKEMRGEIKVKSKQKKYTRFDIFLPRFPEKD